jgi:hypothetical protein
VLVRGFLSVRLSISLVRGLRWAVQQVRQELRVQFDGPFATAPHLALAADAVEFAEAGEVGLGQPGQVGEMQLGEHLDPQGHAENPAFRVVAVPPRPEAIATDVPLPRPGGEAVRELDQWAFFNLGVPVSLAW